MDKPSTLAFPPPTALSGLFSLISVTILALPLRTSSPDTPFSLNGYAMPSVSVGRVEVVSVGGMMVLPMIVAPGGTMVAAVGLRLLVIALSSLCTTCPFACPSSTTLRDREREGRAGRSVSLRPPSLACSCPSEGVDVLSVSSPSASPFCLTYNTHVSPSMCKHEAIYSELTLI